MLPFNAEFQTGKSKITQVRVDVLLASGIPLHMTEEHVMLSGLVRDSSTTVDGQFTVGAAVTGKLSVIIDNSDSAYSGYDFRGAEITASLGGQLSDGAYQLVQIGIYTVDEYVYNGSTITLTAYDNLKKFDVPCNSTLIQPTFPATITQMISLACSVAGVTLANIEIPNGSYSIRQAPASWNTMTWHDVIAYCAQIACCWARILPNGKLFLAWYDASPFNSSQLDGGTFDTNTTPYSDGAVADGGDFTYATTTSYDGGTFGDRDSAHYLGSVYDLSIDTDDVQITGVIVTLDPTNNIGATENTETYMTKLGTDGYVIVIENNPLIEREADADAVAAYLYDIIVGIRFRPLNASILENPSVEAGDVALVIDRNDNTYTCFISHAIYTTNAATSISCDATKTTQNLKARYGEAEKTRALTQRVYNKAISNAEDAMFTIATAIATTMGLYPYPVSDGQGGTIYIFGNKNTLASSNIQWKFTAGALMVSNDYGATWNGAITAAGQAVLQEIYAVKVNADNILTGTLTVGGQNNQNGLITLRDANNTVCGTIDNIGIAALGSFISYRASDGYATKITAGRAYFYKSGGSSYTYEQLKNLGWADSCGKLNTSMNSSTGKLGISLDSKRDFVALGQSTGEASSTAYIVANINGYEGYTEKCLLYGSMRSLGPLHVNQGQNIHLYNKAANTSQAVRWHFSADTSKYAWIGYSENNNSFYMYCEYGSGPANLRVGNINATGTKHRVVQTKNYGNVGMNAFETSSSHFADIGSGTVGEDGTVTIFFDPVYAETIEMNAEYQVFLTRTSEEETTWVNKQKGFFIVHGDPGATFDWMIVGYQKDYITNRMEQVDLSDPNPNDDPIVEEDTSAIDAVTEMIAQYNEQLEDIA